MAALLTAGCVAPVRFAPESSQSRPLRRAVGAGSLDRSFGRGGRVVLSIDVEPVAALTTSNARVVVLGDPESPGSAEVIRLLRDGRLDRSFGTNGSVALRLFAAYSIVAAPDGKLIVGGVASDGSHAELIRLTSGGGLDSTFGSGGSVQFTFLGGSSNGVLVALVQPDGKILAGGFAESPTRDDELTSLARFDSSGNADTSFGTNGIVSMQLIGGVTALGLQPNGAILVCGGRFDPSSSLLARFSPDGRLDRSDKGGTLATLAHTGSLTFEGANEFDARGRLLQWSAVPKASKQYVRVARLLRSQMRDRHFRSRSFAFDSPAANVPADVEIGSDGALLVAGRGAKGDLAKSVFGVARLLAGGELDPSFGTNGRVVTAFGASAQATALTIEADGKIVVAGATLGSGSSSAVAVARYLAR